ncbi:uncharacterized protein [Periplaneta americana]|uniref:uncharacterized protein n=1 Tax=Periplaneta americana TaxID=6978 RepID=UPI0037E901B0
MRTSLLIFVLGAFVPFFFVEVASETLHNPKVVVDRLEDSTQKVIDETKDSGVKAKLIQARADLLGEIYRWHLAVEGRVKRVQMHYDKVKKGTSPFIDAASTQNKVDLHDILDQMYRWTRFAKRG